MLSDHLISSNYDFIITRFTISILFFLIDTAILADGRPLTLFI